MQLITDSNNFVLIRDYLKQGPQLASLGVFCQVQSRAIMGCCSWFNVRLMNCEIFIFTSSLSFWDPFSFFLMVGEVPSLLDC